MLKRFILGTSVLSVLASPAAGQTADDLGGAVYVLSRSEEKLFLLVLPYTQATEVKRGTIVQVFAPPMPMPPDEPLHRLDTVTEFDCGLLRSRDVSYTPRTETGSSLGTVNQDSPQWGTVEPGTVSYSGMQIACSMAFVSTERGDAETIIATWKNR